MKLIEKIYLKLTDAKEYKNREFLDKLQKVVAVDLNVENKNSYHFKHSGNCGDIIYALPTMFALAKGAQIHFHLEINKAADYHKKMKHPLGNLMLNNKMFEMLSPLLLMQPEIQTCNIYDNHPVDYDLDKVREYPLLLDRGNIARWYGLIYPSNPDLNNAWLHVVPDVSFKNSIVIARSSRYRALSIDYSFLKKYSNVVFVGLEDEYNDMKLSIPEIKYIPVTNFLELANIIAGAKFFIGNQSFPYSIAEALKVPRLLELYFKCPNVNVYGNNGYDFCFQPQFEFLVDKMYNEY